MADNHGSTTSCEDARPSRNQDAVTLVPLIGDLLRTRYCVPGSVFLVEDVKSTPVSKSGRWQAVQLLLGDAELCIQALLNGPLHRFVETEEVYAGCYVRLGNFDLKWAPQSDAGGEMAYLLIDDLITVGWNNGYRALWKEQSSGQE